MFSTLPFYQSTKKVAGLTMEDLLNNSFSEKIKTCNKRSRVLDNPLSHPHCTQAGQVTVPTAQVPQKYLWSMVYPHFK